MQKKYIPKFFADTKKSRNNKEYSDEIIKVMNCPMDIMAQQISDEIIPYAPRQSHEPLRNLLNKGIIGKGIREKKEKVIKQAELYNKRNKWIESSKSDLKDSCYYLLKQRIIKQFLYRASKNLDQETIMQLVIFAFNDDNSDIRGAILNFLYASYKDEFLNCFVRNEQKTTKITAQTL